MGWSDDEREKGEYKDCGNLQTPKEDCPPRPSMIDEQALWKRLR